MPNNLKDRVEWFLNNLNYQLEDLSFEREGIACDLYFDTSNVRDAVLGMSAFHQPGLGFELRNFNDRKTLVHCLMASGWLGKVHMLPPHQAEFLTLLNIFSSQETDADLRDLGNQFMQSISLPMPIEISTLEGMTNQDIGALVDQQVGFAEKFFKAVECINGNWQTRLWTWRQKGILELERREYNFSLLIHSDQFKTLKKAFDDKRPAKSISNFADAMALCILLELFEQFKSGQSKRIPRFFLPAHDDKNTFGKVVKEHLNNGELKIQGSSGQSINIFRDEDYFVFKAMFRPQTGNRSSQSSYMTELTIPGKLAIVRDRVAEIVQAQEPLTEELINEIDVAGKPLSGVIADFENLGFFENVWLRYAAATDVQKAARRLVDTTAEVQKATRRLVDTTLALRQSSKFWAGVQQAVNETRDALRKNVKGYKVVHGLWMELEKATDALRNRLNGQISDSFDLFWEFGLLRFAYPNSVINQIDHILKALVSSGEDEARQALTAVIAACQTKGTESHQTVVEGLAVASAALWITQMFGALIRLLERKSGLPHYSLKIVYAAALFRERKRIGDGQKIIRELEQIYANTENEFVRADLAVGIAYLYFHYAESSGFKVWWREEFKRPNSDLPVPVRAALDKAIAKAKEAHDLLMRMNGDTKKRIYALNLYLYYAVEAGGDEMLDDIRRAADELMGYKHHRELWQYRFDDSLARYYHRLARSAQSQLQWEECMESALRRAKEALAIAYGDDEVEINLDRIKSEFSSGYLDAQ
jgi:hypothetical protein